jgi:outer membrane protein OmpA-like peptidoglycan-associated protein
VLANETFRLRTPSEDWLVRIDRFAGPPGAEQRELARRALTDLRFGLEVRDPVIVATAQRIVAALDGAGSFGRSGLRALGPSVSDSAFEHELLRRLEQELDRGRLVLEREQLAPLTNGRERIELQLPPLPPARRESNRRTFEVRFVDEVGKAISGIDAEFTADGVQTRASNAGGISLLQDVQSSSAKVAILDPDALSKVLDPRWENFRRGTPPKEANTTKVIFRGAELGPFELKAEVPNTVVIKPPLGLLFVELWDKRGRVRHANRKYRIDGPMQFSGQTDEDGRLEHQDVFPGDYTLTLTVEFFEGKDRQVTDYQSQLVVLDAAGGGPQVRMLGAAPHVVMARMRGMLFDTNKSFLLPTALKSLRKMREIYEATRPSQLLIVGHTDTTAEPDINDPLSVERARSTRAYLQDDVDTWLKNYDVSGPARWGAREDRLMITQAMGFVERVQNEDIVEWFQRTRKLKVDGKPGPEARRQLITEYMQLDGVNLIADQQLNLVIETHGAGENFPLKDTGFELDSQAADEQEDVFDRRVEMFFFDSEFGVVPAPGAANGSEYLEWRRRAAEDNDFVAGPLAPTAVTLIEVKDVFFRTDSAVAQQNLVCPSVFALALAFAKARRLQRLVIAGHTDTRAPDSHNEPLSQERADNTLACLEGNRARFVELSLARHKIADQKQILKFVTTKLGFDCDPGALDEDAFTAIGPVRKFQQQYNELRAALGVPGAAALTVDGSVGRETWGAFFDCYEAFLASQVSNRAGIRAQLSELRDQRGLLQFIDDRHKAIGFGERYPVDHPGVDNVASATNRRVELLFFPQDDLPDVTAPPDISEIYLPGRYTRQPLDPCAEPLPPPPPPIRAPNAAPGRARIFARAVRADGSRVPDVQAFLFDVTVGRSQIDAQASTSGEIDFGEHDPGTYEVDIVKSGFDAGPKTETVAAGERKVFAVLMTPIGTTTNGRIVVDEVLTTFRMVGSQQVSPFLGDFIVLSPDSIGGTFPNERKAAEARDAQALLEHRAAIKAKIAQLRSTHGSNFQRVSLDSLEPVVLVDTQIEKDAPDGVNPIAAPIDLQFIEVVTSRTLMIISLSK